jgi:hypothetical protein
MRDSVTDDFSTGEEKLQTGETLVLYVSNMRERRWERQIGMRGASVHQTGASRRIKQEHEVRRRRIGEEYCECLT